MRTHFLAFTAALALAACKADKALLPPAGSIITISDYFFTPDSLVVSKGTIVEWDNNGPSAHNVTSDSSLWASPLLTPPSGGGGPYGGGGSAGGSFRFTFDSAGT